MTTHKLSVSGYTEEEILMCQHVLFELANADLDNLNTGVVELCGEDDKGREGWAEVNFQEYAAKAAAILGSVDAAPDEFYIEFKSLRKALCMMGIAAPESDGELGVRMQSYAKQVIRAVARKYPQPAADAAVLAEALEEIARWSERWASADHPVATVARKALEDFRQQGGDV